MPRKFGSDSIICNRKKAPCYEKVLYSIAHSQNEEYSCSYCLPACFEIHYEREISSSVLGTGDFIIKEPLPNDDPEYIENNLAIIHIFFLENSYGGFTKTEFIGFTDFLSNIGGILGLFMGFSVISLLEIIYFLSLRPYYDGKRNKVQHGEEDFGASNKRVSVFKTNLIGPMRFNKETTCWDIHSNPSVWKRLKIKLRNVKRIIGEKIANLLGAIGVIKKEEEAPFPFCN